MQAGGAHHREDAHFADALLAALDNLVDRQSALLEELFHEGVIAFGHHLDQRFVGLLRGIGELGGDLALLALAVAIRRVGVGLHADQVDDALEIAFGADGDLDGDGGAAEDLLDAGQGALEIGAFAIELIDNDGAGKLEIVGERPDLFGLHFDAGHAVDQHQGGIGGDQRGRGCR